MADAPATALPMHYVCTLPAARKLVDAHDRWWVSSCGCRDGMDRPCGRSHHDVCLMFFGDASPSGKEMKEVSRKDVEALVRLAAEKKLVPRPFRRAKDMSITEGVCFCCDDCCGYFLNHEEKCDKGAEVERTGMDTCSSCGICVEACFFGARLLVNGAFEVKTENCFGCGLCVEECPEKCIQMVRR